MSTDKQTAHGIDLETLEGFAEHAADDPEAVQLGLGRPRPTRDGRTQSGESR